MILESWRQARWLRVVIAGVRRWGLVLRVTAAALAALGLLSVAVIGGEEPVGAQAAESTGVGISLDDLSNYPTHLTVDRFLVELTNLTATEEYQVTVSSDSARVGIGGCGTRSRTETVTGVATRDLVLLVYACAVGEATVTAEVRRTGASSAEASVSQRLMVEAIPENAIGARGERIRAPAAGAVPKAGTPGSVPNTYFTDVTSNSARANWETPSDGGTPLTGFGLLFWRDGTAQPPYSSALVKGKSARSHPYENLQPATTYKWRIHACNGPDSCGYWTVPIVQVTTDPAPEDTPTPTPRPTAAPPPPVSGAPSFGPVAAADYKFRVGHSLVDLPLPAATGGSGALTYSLAPAVRQGPTFDLGNGLTFDADTRAISGTPAAAANRATYIYTVTDADRKTAQIPVSITVFDIAEAVLEGGVARPLLESTWGVLGYRAVVLEEGTILRTDGHQLQLRIPAGAGFQFGKTCTWPAAAPTDTTMLESPWLPSNYGFHVVRCALGGGDAVRVEVQARLGGDGMPAELYHATMNIKTSWHRHDNLVTYYVRGTSGATIHGVTTDTQEGLFPKSTSTPNPVLTTLVNYQESVGAWNEVPMGGVTLGRASSAAGADVVIEGYWDPHPAADRCGGSVACTLAAGDYPHIGNGQRFLIEDPPRWPRKSQETWTTVFDDADMMPDVYEYLPWVLMHEFGHTLGLGEGGDSDDIMGGARQRDLSDGDAKGLRATYAHHRDDH